MNQDIKPVQIGNCLVGPGKPTLVIAEIGINHNGSVDIALQLIDAAKKCGCNAVKFQKRTVEKVYTAAELAQVRQVHPEILQSAVTRGVLPKEAVSRLQDSKFENSTNGDLKFALELTREEYQLIARHCEDQGILWFASCWDEDSVNFMEEFNPPCYKIASASLTDDNLITYTRKMGRPIILSTGMSDMPMIEHAVEVLGTENLILMHCTSYYPPTTLSKVADYGLHLLNLDVIQTLEKRFGVPVGFSSHDTGVIPSYTAAVLGACAVEKHITIWRGMWGSDQAASIEPGELDRLCRMIREWPAIRGDGVKRFYDEEKPVAKKLRRK